MRTIVVLLRRGIDDPDATTRVRHLDLVTPAVGVKRRVFEIRLRWDDCVRDVRVHDSERANW